MDLRHLAAAYAADPSTYLLADTPPPERPSPAAPPQWTHAETAAFLQVRAELDSRFSTSKRNRALWEAAAARLAERGFARSAEQCKSKWKNLVTRFKGAEAAAADHAASSSAAAGSRFPFQEEIRAILTRPPKGKEAGDDEEEETEDDGDDEEEEEMPVPAKRPRRSTRKKGSGSAALSSAVREAMERQEKMEAEWMATEAARRAEWRQSMLAIAEQQVALVRRWSEREEERRQREEARAEQRHALITDVLTRLAGGGGGSIL